MALVCSISGQAPEEPVVSNTGYIFEKRLITKHIQANNKCPITGGDLTIDDLMDVKVSKAVKPRPITAASIPGLLTMLQNEWDTLMTETYTLRSHLDMVRNQLSHSLYQHDAACRVVARLIRERDAARNQVATLQQQFAQAKAAEGAGEGEPGIDDALKGRMGTLAKQLLAMRKKRQTGEIISAERMKSFKCTGTFPIHSTTPPGITALDFDKKTSWNIVTGGVDGAVVLFDLKQKKTLCKMTGHVKRVNKVCAHSTENIVISGSEDKTIRVWSCVDVDSSQYKCSHVIRRHNGEILDLSIHPLGEYIISSGKDNSWNFHDIHAGKTLKSLQRLSTIYRSVQIHPDGMIMAGGGDDGKIFMWDLKSQEEKACLEGHTGPVSCLAFSENGYYLASASRDSTIRLWDLRKSMCFQSFPPFEAVDASGGLNDVTFDYSGQYLGAAGSMGVSLHYFEARANMAPVVKLTGHDGPVTALRFGDGAGFLVTTSMDRTVRLWEPATEEGV